VVLERVETALQGQHRELNFAQRFRAVARRFRRRALDRLARRAVAVADVARVIGARAEHVAAAILAGRAVAVADVARVVARRAVWHALAVEAAVVEAAADVAAIVLARTGRGALAIGAARAVAAANAARIGVEARELHLDDGVAQREEVFTNTIVLERAHERQSVEEPFLVAVAWRLWPAALLLERGDLLDRPFEIRLGARGGGVPVLRRVRQDRTRRLVQEASVGAVETGAGVQVEAEALRVERHRAAREAVRAVGFLRSIAQNDIRNAVRFAAGRRAEIDRNQRRLRVGKVRHISTAALRQRSRRTALVAIAIGITANTIAVDTHEQLIRSVVI